MPRLSVLIPAYNWSVAPLVRSLVWQIADGGVDADIHLFDDGSTEPFASEFQTLPVLAASSGVRLHVYRPPANVGRSAARNELLARSQGEWVLFLDADVLPDQPDFLQRYLDAVAQGHEVVCGGISYRQCKWVSPAQRFYYRYSNQASVATTSTRNARAWAWIFTANMMSSRRVVDAVPFDHGFVGYGYEDIEWGIRLDRFAGILHIDNPVTHMGLLDKRALQRKMAEAAPNLVRMFQLHPDLAGDMGLVRIARAASRWPTPLLRAGAALAGGLFSHVGFWFRLELVCFQLEKVLRAAIAFKAAQRLAA